MRLSLFAGLFLVAALILVGGAGVAVWGWATAGGPPPRPTQVDLARLEAGELPDNDYVEIGPHLACYAGAVFTYEAKEPGRHRLPDDTVVVQTLYPIVSTANPDVKELEALRQRFGDADDVPDDVPTPFPVRFTVLVRTNRFRTVGAVPKDFVRSETKIRGVVSTKFPRFQRDEQGLLQERFPLVDFRKVIVLDLSRKPPPPGPTESVPVAAGLAAAGVGFVGLIGIGIWGLFRLTSTPKPRR
jgi:hypothetical protein